MNTPSFTDDLREALHSPECPFPMDDDGSPHLPKSELGFEQWHKHAKVRWKPRLRRARYFLAGADWAGPQDAIQRTCGELLPEMLALSYTTLSAGFLIGYNKVDFENFDWDYFPFPEIDLLGEIAETAHGLVEDTKLRELVLDYLQYLTERFTANSGFNQTVGKEVEHVWNVWEMIFNASTVSFYNAATQLGEKCHTQQALSGLAESLRTGD